MELMGAHAGKLALTLALALVFLLGAPVSQADYMLSFPENVRDASYVGGETCLECHDEVGAEFMEGLHGTVHEYERPGWAADGCEACHGPGSVHAETGEVSDIVTPGQADPVLSARLCLQCHRSTGDGGFEQSHHSLGDLDCTSSGQDGPCRRTDQ